MDLGCGFQSALPSGTRSTTLRVVAVSRSSCASNRSFNFICISPVRRSLLEDEMGRSGLEIEVDDCQRSEIERSVSAHQEKDRASHGEDRPEDESRDSRLL